MPELPEVEAARRAVQDNCIGKKIRRSVVADDPKVVDGVSPSDFQASLIGKNIVAAHRKGKNMWLELDSPPFPSFQFGMAGAIYIKGVAVAKYKRITLWENLKHCKQSQLDDGLELSFTDKRRFAKVRLLQNPATVPPISELGPDALSEPMTTDQFIDSLSKKKIGIKALLLDQTSAFVPELQKLSGSQAAKAAPKPRKQSAKASKDVESDDDAGGSSVSEEEEGVKKVNRKGGKRTKGESKARPPSKRKSNGKVKDDDEDDGNESDRSEDDEADKNKKKKGNASGKGKAKATIGSRKKK